MYDTTALIQAGINPKNGLPYKFGSNNLDDYDAKYEYKKVLRNIDEQDAINRFTWYNLPKGLNGRLMERILYYRGQGIFFKFGEQFMFLPFALDGSIDVYGRFTQVTPLPFNGSTTSTTGKKKEEKPWIIGLTRKPEYEVQLPEDYINDDGSINVQAILDCQENSCVIIKDYSEQLGQTNIPRQQLQEAVIDEMSNMIPFMHTALLNATGVQGMRVNTQSDYSNVEAASRAVNHAALTGKKWVAMVGDVNFQDLTNGNVGKAEEFLLALQSLDNFRLSAYGIGNGGLFQKKSHMLEAEQNMNTGNVGLILQDSLRYRQDACDIINSIWGLNVWCDVSETLINIDRNMDGVFGGQEQPMQMPSQQTSPTTMNGGDETDV